MMGNGAICTSIISAAACLDGPFYMNIKAPAYFVQQYWEANSSFLLS